MPDANTKLLLHCNGADASTTFTDETGKTMTAVGNAQIDTAQSKFGGASGLFDGNGDRVTTPDHTDWAFGSGDFTLECWVRFAAVANYPSIMAQANGSSDTSDNAWLLRWFNNNLDFKYTTTGSSNNYVYVQYAWTPSANTWYHVALVRNGADLMAFINGTQIGSTHNISTSTIYNSTRSLWIGSMESNSGEAEKDWNGWLDEVRISNVARWTANFTAPTAEYNGAVAAIRQSCDGFAFNVG